jgi:hypothetical protein
MGLLSRRDNTSVEVPPLARPKRKRIGEISTAWASEFVSGIRKSGLWPRPVQYVSGSTKLTYAKAREIYRNDGDMNLGTGFGKRIVNAQVDFIDLPMSATGDEVVDEFLNRGIHVFWTGELQQMFRDSLRDAETVVRVRRYDQNNPLISADEWESCYLEVVPPETVAIFYREDGTDNREIEAAYVRHEISHIKQRATDTGAVLRQPEVVGQVVIEEITPEKYRYYNETEGRWMGELESANPWNFVPFLQVSNEYEATLQGGQSEYEQPLPFMGAFHDVMSQSLVAHKSHSIPKVKFKVNDMMTFLANNWPDAFELDSTGRPDINSFNGQISWKGTEILFFDAENEDADLLQVTSALGDSKTLLDFLLTCIAISSETPKSLLMDQTAQDADEMVPWAAKINRKRKSYQPYIQQICKMVLAINFMDPVRVPLSWEEITPDQALKKAQALQQDVMSYEVLATRQVISDGTIRKQLRRGIPAMQPGTQEAADAKKNVSLNLTPGGTGATSTGSVKGTDSGNSKQPGNQN